MGLEESPQSGLFNESANPPLSNNAPLTVLAYTDAVTGLPVPIDQNNPMPASTAQLGGNAITLAAGQDVTQGNTTDAAATTGTGGTQTIASLIRGMFNAILRLGGFTGTHIADVATHNDVVASACTLGRIVINSKGGAGLTASVYDGHTSAGTLKAVVDLSSGPLSLDYNMKLATALSIVTAGGTAADITVLTGPA